MLIRGIRSTSLARLAAGVSALAVAVSFLAGASVAQAAPTSPAAGTPNVSLATTGPGSALIGSTATFAMVATNPAGGVAAYNATFQVTLPPGVDFVSGSSRPSSAGNPTQYSDPVTGETVLVWSNLADLQPAGSYRLAFKTQADPTSYPVGDAMTLDSAVYVNSDPRYVPKFDAQGAPIESSYTGWDSAPSVTTDITALQISKTEPSPEGELLRGVHDQTTVYTLTVTNNDFASTKFVTVTDYLPAGLEFLQCGGIDNSPAGQVEYAGAPRLTVVPVVAANCLTPDLVETIEDPAGRPAGVYTKVQWTLGSLSIGEVAIIRYRAGIPLQENTLDFGGQTPTPESLDQAANLSNNSGPSTRETSTEKVFTNYSEARGYYTGDVDGVERRVTAHDTESVTSEDLRVVKSVSPSVFFAGGIATYTLTMQTSEYRRATAAKLIDTLPDGLCPISATANTSIDADPQCAPQSGHAPTGASYSLITPDVDGTTEVVFTPVAEIGQNGTAIVTFQAVMRDTYSGTGRAGDATVGGDGFTNTVVLGGVSRPLAVANPPDPFIALNVADASWARQTVSTSSIDKQISRPSVGTMDCSTADYFSPTATPDTRPIYAAGDRICFKLRVNFPSAAGTKDPVVTDVIPTDTHYEAGSWAAGAANTVPGGQISFNTAAANAGNANPTWTLGAAGSDGEFVEQGRIFEVYFSVLVDAPSGATTPDVTGNLMKFRSTNTAGEALSLRDQVDFKVAPAVPMSLNKTGDRTSVVGGGVVNYSIAVRNTGSAATGTDVPVSDIEVWDKLPAGISCVNVGAISAGGACQAPAALTVSSIRWTLAGPIPAGATAPALTYTVNYPTEVPAGKTYTNTAGIRVYAVQGNTGDSTDFYPKNNIDPDVPVADQNAPRADDPHSVTVPAVAIAKTGTTSVTETNNNAANQATIGELVTYTVRATVTGLTTVYDGILNDPVPTGMTLVGDPTATMDGGALPAGASIGVAVVSGVDNVRLRLPSTFGPEGSNTVFEIEYTARVTTAASNVAGTNRRNTATFTSKASVGGSALPAKSSYYDVKIVEPNVVITKTNDSPQPLAPGDPVVYTITVRNGATASPAHDLWITDLLPDRVDFEEFVDRTPQGDATPVANGGSIRWNVGTLAPGATATLRYRATLGSGAVAGTGYRNTATVTDYSLADPDTTPQCATPSDLPVRCYSASDVSQISTVGLAIDKSVDPKVLGPGEWATYTITLVDRRQLTGYNATIIDQVPAGFDGGTATLVSSSCVEAGQSCVLDVTDLSTDPQPDGTTLIGWTIGTLSDGPDDRTVTLTYKVQAGDTLVAGDTRTNVAHMSWNEKPGPRPTDPTDPFDHSSEETTATVRIAEPQLSIAKSNDNTHPGPGEVIGYTVSLRNNGDGNAYNVVVVDTLPSQVRCVPDSANRGGVYDKAKHAIRWVIDGPVRPGDLVRLTYDGELAASERLHAGDSYVNTADLKGYDSAPDGGAHYPGGDDSSAVSPRFPATEIRKTAPKSIARIGVPFEWRLKVTSTGAIRAERIDVTDVLPKGWRYDAGSAQLRIAGGDARRVEPTVTMTLNEQRLRWANAGSLNPGDDLTIVFTASPTLDAALINGVGPAPHVNSAVAIPEDGSGATGNGDGPYGGPEDQAAAFIDSADLSIAKSHTTDPVIAGRGVAYVLTVANAGPNTAEGPITVDDSMPIGLTPMRAGGDGWTCEIVSRDVHCERDNRDQNLAANDAFPDIEITADVDASATGTLVNSASVAGKTYDPDTGNNTDTDRVTPEASADLAIVKTAVGTFERGATATYSLAVRNDGPSTAVRPTVADVLPRGMAFVSGDGAGWACTGSGRNATCVHADGMTPGDRSTITLTVRISNAIAQIVTNRSSVNSTTPDPDPSNNKSTATVDFLKPTQHYRPPSNIKPGRTEFPDHTQEGAVARVSGYCIDLTTHAMRGDMRSCKVVGRDVYVVGTGWQIVVTVRARPWDGYPAYLRVFTYTV